MIHPLQTSIPCAVDGQPDAEDDRSDGTGDDHRVADLRWSTQYQGRARGVGTSSGDDEDPEENDRTHEREGAQEVQ